MELDLYLLILGFQVELLMSFVQLATGRLKIKIPKSVKLSAVTVTYLHRP
jgi:hypothetical protein